jgi:hypothetical protein
LGDIPPGDERNAPIAVISYSFADEKQKRRTVSFGLFKDPRSRGSGIVFDLAIAAGFAASEKGGPVTLAVQQNLENQCGAEGFLRT